MNQKALFAVLIGAVMLLSGCTASSPGKLETSVMTRIKHSLTVGGKADKNPLPVNAENIQAGREAFSHYCVACHGLDGQNTGVPFAEHMSPPVPSLKAAPVQAYTDGQLHYVIANGVAPSGMPASKGILNEDEIWLIVLYLRHLPSAGSLGEPALYSGEMPECGPVSGNTTASTHSGGTPDRQQP